MNGIKLFLLQFLKLENIIQIATAYLIFWYCSDTQRLRESTERQLAFLIAQRQSEVVPVVVFDYEKLEAPRKDRHIKLLNDFDITLENISEQYAKNVSFLIYDNDTKNFWSSNKSRAVLAGGSTMYLIDTSEKYSKLEISGKLNSNYSLCSDCLDLVLNEATKGSYIAAFYQDHLGNAHIIIQTYELIGDSWKLYPFDCASMSHQPGATPECISSSN